MWACENTYFAAALSGGEGLRRGGGLGLGLSGGGGEGLGTGAAGGGDATGEGTGVSGSRLMPTRTAARQERRHVSAGVCCGCRMCSQLMVTAASWAANWKVTMHMTEPHARRMWHAGAVWCLL